MELTSLFLFFLMIIPSAIIHEYFHGWVAYQFGDPTPKYEGRLTLNPLAHLDYWGTILMPVLFFLATNGSFIFAYAKPVPINPLNFRHRYALPLVALAGPLANLLTASVFALLSRIFPYTNFGEILSIIIYTNILLAVFNLLPIPPLDGSKILFYFFPPSWFPFRFFLEQFGFFLLLVFLLIGFHWLFPLVWAIYRLLVGSSSLFFN
jgi:Zn-dependent protease